MSSEATFSAIAAEVMSSPYFYQQPDPSQGADAMIAFMGVLEKEQDALRAGLVKAKAYEDLEGEAKAVYDRADLYRRHWLDDEDVRGRLMEPISITSERTEAQAAQAQRAQLAAAIQAREEGDEEAAKRIEAMTPAEAMAVLGEAGEEGQDDEPDDGPARLSLPAPGSTPPDPAAGPSLLAAAGIRRRILALSKKGSPPPSS